MIGYRVDETAIGFFRIVRKTTYMRHFGEDSIENP